jgi:hypothetical protein
MNAAKAAAFSFVSGEIMRILIACFLVVLTSACGSTVSPYARATSGRIGCPAPEIELDQVDRGERGPESWVAYCGHRGYACSSSAALSNPQSRVVCSELGQPRTGERWRHRY